MEVGYYRDECDGSGMYFDGRSWHYVQRRTGSGNHVPAGHGSDPLSYYGDPSDLVFVSVDRPDNTWRLPVSQTAS